MMGVMFSSPPRPQAARTAGAKYTINEKLIANTRGTKKQYPHQHAEEARVMGSSGVAPKIWIRPSEPNLTATCQDRCFKQLV